MFLNLLPGTYRMEGDLIRIKMHHGGSFSKEGELCYVGGQVSIFCNCDSERLSYFCLVDMTKDVGFNAGDELFYAIPGYNLENGNKLHDDHSVRKMLNYTKKSKSAELYIKHLEQGVSATPRFGQDVADNHGEEVLYLDFFFLLHYYLMCCCVMPLFLLHWFVLIFFLWLFCSLVKEPVLYS